MRAVAGLCCVPSGRFREIKFFKQKECCQARGLKYVQYAFVTQGQRGLPIDTPVHIMSNTKTLITLNGAGGVIMGWDNDNSCAPPVWLEVGRDINFYNA